MSTTARDLEARRPAARGLVLLLTLVTLLVVGPPAAAQDGVRAPADVEAAAGAATTSAERKPCDTTRYDVIAHPPAPDNDRVVGHVEYQLHPAPEDCELPELIVWIEIYSGRTLWERIATSEPFTPTRLGRHPVEAVAACRNGGRGYRTVGWLRDPERGMQSVRAISEATTLKCPTGSIDPPVDETTALPVPPPSPFEEDWLGTGSDPSGISLTGLAPSPAADDLPLGDDPGEAPCDIRRYDAGATRTHTLKIEDETWVAGVGWIYLHKAPDGCPKPQFSVWLEIYQGRGLWELISAREPVQLEQRHVDKYVRTGSARRCPSGTRAYRPTAVVHDPVRSIVETTGPTAAHTCPKW